MCPSLQLVAMVSWRCHIGEISAYASLFGAAFLAATLLPAQSEILLSALLISGRYSPVVLLLVATCGNVIGSVANWALGRFLSGYRDPPWFPVSPSAAANAQRWYDRWGHWSLLLSWVPVIGDPLTFVGGLLRTKLHWFLLIVTIAKGGRYLVLAAAVASFWP